MRKTKIEWTEQTWNPSVGCTKISDGCKHCYAETMAKRLEAMGTKGYEEGFKFHIMEERLFQPLEVKRPTKFFVNSMSDLFHEEMPFDYIDKVMDIIAKTPRHVYQVLTKRDERMKQYFSSRKIPSNIWLGVTVESEKYVSRIDSLRVIDAKIKFISMEPLLSDINGLNLKGIHWVIVGGESGAKARPMNPEWAKNIKDQCKKQKTAFFFKQWGTWGADGRKRSKKANGRILEGKVWEEYPVFV